MATIFFNEFSLDIFYYSSMLFIFFSSAGDVHQDRLWCLLPPLDFHSVVTKNLINCIIIINHPLELDIIRVGRVWHGVTQEMNITRLAKAWS